MRKACSLGLAIAATLYASQLAWATTLIIESRDSGQNYGMYSESGIWANSQAKSSASGLTVDIGSRYGSTYRSIALEKHAIFTPDLPEAGLYEVFTTWGNGSNRRENILHRVTHAGGVTDIDVDQSMTYGQWVSLGEFAFNAGNVGIVDISNLHTDVSGSFYADAVKFVQVPEPAALIMLAAGALLFRRSRSGATPSI